MAAGFPGAVVLSGAVVVDPVVAALSAVGCRVGVATAPVADWLGAAVAVTTGVVVVSSDCGVEPPPDEHAASRATGTSRRSGVRTPSSCLVTAWEGRAPLASLR
jgi:hypothetical protein